MKLASTAARCADVCRRAAKNLGRGELADKPFEELAVIMGTGATDAATCFYGRCGGLVEHDQISQWSDEIREYFDGMAARLLSTIVSGAGEASPTPAPRKRGWDRKRR